MNRQGQVGRTDEILVRVDVDEEAMFLALAEECDGVIEVVLVVDSAENELRVRIASRHSCSEGNQRTDRRVR